MEKPRPDVEAAIRGGDWSLPMDGEGVPAEASLKQALYWRQVYTEILAMEEKVLDRIRKLMAKQSEAGRREVELTNLPVVVAQAEKFRQRLGYWQARVQQLDGDNPLKV
jgi:hypothetical protein